jgi:hypothetical protein
LEQGLQRHCQRAAELSGQGYAAHWLRNVRQVGAAALEVEARPRHCPEELSAAQRAVRDLGEAPATPSKGRGRGARDAPSEYSPASRRTLRRQRHASGWVQRVCTRCGLSGVMHTWMVVARLMRRRGWERGRAQADQLLPLVTPSKDSLGYLSARYAQAARARTQSSAPTTVSMCSRGCRRASSVHRHRRSRGVGSRS